MIRPDDVRPIDPLPVRVERRAAGDRRPCHRRRGRRSVARRGSAKIRVQPRRRPGPAAISPRVEWTGTSARRRKADGQSWPERRSRPMCSGGSRERRPQRHARLAEMTGRRSAGARRSPGAGSGSMVDVIGPIIAPCPPLPRPDLARVRIIGSWPYSCSFPSWPVLQRRLDPQTVHRWTGWRGRLPASSSDRPQAVRWGLASPGQSGGRARRRPSERSRTRDQGAPLSVQRGHRTDSGLTSRVHLRGRTALIPLSHRVLRDGAPLRKNVQTVDVSAMRSPGELESGRAHRRPERRVVPDDRRLPRGAASPWSSSPTSSANPDS